MVALYGIASCDTVRKARRWLDANGAAYRYHDLREDGLDKAVLQRWIAALGWESLLNRRSTTWRDLAAGERNGLDLPKATTLLLKHPTLIKRPVLVHDGNVYVGFAAERYEELFPPPG